MLVPGLRLEMLQPGLRTYMSRQSLQSSGFPGRSPGTRIRLLGRDASRVGILLKLAYSHARSRAVVPYRCQCRTAPERSNFSTTLPCRKATTVPVDWLTTIAIALVLAVMEAAA